MGETIEGVLIYLQDKYNRGNASLARFKLPKVHGIPRAHEFMDLPYTVINGFMFRRDQSYRVGKLTREYTKGRVRILIQLLRVEND